MARKSLLYLSVKVPEYDAATGDRYETEMLRELSSRFDIHIAAGICANPGLYIHHASRYFGYAASLHVGDILRTLVTLEKSAFDFDIVMFGKCATAPWFHTVRALFPRALTIANTVDILYRRESMLCETAKKYSMDLRGIPAFPLTPDRTRRDELDFYRRVDRVIVVSEEDKELLSRDGISPDKISVCIIRQPVAPTAYNPDGRYLTFVGYAEHLPNYLSMKVFIDTVLPHMDRYLSAHRHRIVIVGRDFQNLYRGLARESLVEAPGYIRDIQSRYYAHTCLSLAPLVAGSGVKGKILEALAHGLPVVTTDVGLQGLDLFRHCTIHIDMNEPRAAAEKIIYHLDHRESRQELSRTAVTAMIDYNKSGSDYASLCAQIARMHTPADGGFPTRCRHLARYWRWRYVEKRAGRI